MRLRGRDLAWGRAEENAKGTCHDATDENEPGPLGWMAQEEVSAILKPEFLGNFFQWSPGQMTLGAFRFAKFKQVLHIFDPFAQGDVFGVREEN